VIGRLAGSLLRWWWITGDRRWPPFFFAIWNSATIYSGPSIFLSIRGAMTYDNSGVALYVVGDGPRFFSWCAGECNWSRVARCVLEGSRCAGETEAFFGDWE
jgi:hypothetical protein